MSAPAQGRNSPEPSDQSDAQQQGVPASGKIDDGSKDDGNNNQTGGSKEASDDTKNQGLESNPTGPIEAAAGRKV